MSTEDVILVAGTIIEYFDTDVSMWKRAPRITSTGEVGSMAEGKAKTTLEDSIKRFGSGLREGGDKTFKGQQIPPQEEGSEHSVDRLLQQTFLDKCAALTEMPLRITYPDFDRVTFTFKALGKVLDDSTSEDWKMFTCGGKQNSLISESVAPTLTGVEVTGTSDMTVGDKQQLVLTNTPLESFYGINQDEYVSSDPAVISVTSWGYVTAISAGTSTVTVVRYVGDGTTVTDTFDVTVTA